jgi:predicted ATPase/DNA-binding SARP family transcriptional activator
MPPAKQPRPHVDLRFYFLCAFRIERNAHPLHLPTRKHEALLAYLVLFPHTHAREKLAALFWGDTPNDQARLSLRVALAALRKELGDDFLIADRETVQLNPDVPIWVDAREISNFKFQISDWESAQSEILNLKSEIDLLPDFYDDWILLERERLRAIYLDALLRLIQHARSNGEYARAIELARKLLATEPANETAYQHLIFCHLAQGDRAAALKQYAACERALRDELNVAPSPETRALYARAQTQEARGKSLEALFTNLPTPLSSFVGRQKEIREIKELLETVRLITLTGAGGCGKTRLAIQTATEIAADEKFKDGVWWIDLSAMANPALVTQAVATVFNVSESSSLPLIAVLTSYLRAKALLIVLDNCEHLVGACAELIGTLLSACPRVRVLATSREALNISGETTWVAPSLAMPDTAQIPLLAQLRRFDATQLFTERAISVARNWRLADNIVPVVQVCARLDGIPLALELAAAQLKHFSIEQIAARLDDRFNLLANETRGAIPRHQTLRAAMDWSYDLLSDAERALLQKLSVFASGFTLEAVESVCSQQSTVNSEQSTVNSEQSTVNSEQ